MVYQLSYPNYNPNYDADKRAQNLNTKVSWKGAIVVYALMGCISGILTNNLYGRTVWRTIWSSSFVPAVSIQFPYFLALIQEAVLFPVILAIPVQHLGSSFYWYFNSYFLFFNFLEVLICISCLLFPFFDPISIHWLNSCVFLCSVYMPFVPLLPLLDPSSSLDVSPLSKVLLPFLVPCWFSLWFPLSLLVPVQTPSSFVSTVSILGLPGPQLGMGALIPQLHLGPLSPGLHLGLWTHWLYLGSSLPHFLHWPSFHWLCRAPASPHFNFISRHSGFATGFQAYSFRSAIHPFGSIRLCLLPICPQSLWLH